MTKKGVILSEAKNPIKDHGIALTLSLPKERGRKRVGVCNKSL